MARNSLNTEEKLAVSLLVLFCLSGVIYGIDIFLGLLSCWGAK